MDQTPSEVWNNKFAGFLLDAMAEGVFTLDPDGRITSWNPSMEKITGYRADEAIGKLCDLIRFSTCFNQRCPTDIHNCKIFERGAVNSKECRLVHKKGHVVAVIKNARVVKNDDGRIIGVVETVTDLTDLIDARRKVEETRLKLSEAHRFSNIVGKSHGMREVFMAIKAAAASDANVLILGESGTGKELVAGAIHFNSDRSEGPLIAVNCSALSESILESELFGHVRGAFTGAHKDRTGRFEEAHGGTIFLDEIGEISPYIQLKLLRTIQERQIERVGESEKRSIDFRIITATNKDLYTLVKEGLFREDLYYRLKVFPIHLPPLRNRKEDIPILIDHFIQMFNGKTGKHVRDVSPEALRKMMDYPWPGNVRELENAVEHAFVLCPGERIQLSDLPSEILQNMSMPTAGNRVHSSKTGIKRKPTKAELMELLHECGWNKAEVARRLNISRTSVWKYMKKWSIPLLPD